MIERFKHLLKNVKKKDKVERAKITLKKRGKGGWKPGLFRVEKGDKKRSPKISGFKIIIYKAF